VQSCNNQFFVRYLLYNINPGEGFNLRRDGTLGFVIISVINFEFNLFFKSAAVYIRMACLSKYLQKFGDWILVVGPISTPHWKSNEAVEWKHFFDLNSLSKYVPVIELNDLLLSSGINDMFLYSNIIIIFSRLISSLIVICFLHIL